MNKKNRWRPQTTRIPGSDLPATYYINLASKAFMAYMASMSEQELASDEFYYKNLCHEFGQLLDFLAEHLELEEPSSIAQREREHAEEALKD